MLNKCIHAHRNKNANIRSKEDDAAGTFNAILEQKQRRAIRLDAVFVQRMCNVFYEITRETSA